MKKKASVLLGILLICSTFSLNNGYCLIIKEKGQTFLVDMTGEKWDISQAVSIGIFLVNSGNCLERSRTVSYFFFSELKWALTSLTFR